MSHSARVERTWSAAGEILAKPSFRARRGSPICNRSISRSKIASRSSTGKPERKGDCLRVSSSTKRCATMRKKSPCRWISGGGSRSNSRSPRTSSRSTGTKAMRFKGSCSKRRESNARSRRSPSTSNAFEPSRRLEQLRNCRKISKSAFKKCWEPKLRNKSPVKRSPTNCEASKRNLQRSPRVSGMTSRTTMSEACSPD